MQPFEIALFLAVLLLLLEMATGVLVFLSLSVGLLFVAGAELFFRDFYFVRDILLFTIMTIVAFVGLRLMFRSKGDTKTADGDINTY